MTAGPVAVMSAIVAAAAAAPATAFASGAETTMGASGATGSVPMTVVNQSPREPVLGLGYRVGNFIGPLAFVVRPGLRNRADASTLRGTAVWMTRAIAGGRPKRARSVRLSGHDLLPMRPRYVRLYLGGHQRCCLSGVDHLYRDDGRRIRSPCN